MSTARTQRMTAAIGRHEVPSQKGAQTDDPVFGLCKQSDPSAEGVVDVLPGE